MRNFGGGGKFPSNIFFLLKNFFYLVTELKRGKSKNWGDSGGEGCIVY